MLRILKIKNEEGKSEVSLILRMFDVSLRREAARCSNENR
jgi:hypothetical protein